MGLLQTTLESTTKIRFHDCDPFNHLNNSRYIDYIISAREDQLLEHYAFDVYRLARETATSWVVAQTQISYLYPAFLMEEVTIQTRLIAHTDKSLLLEGIMWDAAKTMLKAVMWTKLVHVNMATQKSISHSGNLMDLFRQIQHPADIESGFEQRVSRLREQGVERRASV